MKKPRTARAVEANVGTRNAYAKKLRKINRDFSRTIYKEILQMLIDEGYLKGDEGSSNVVIAQDASFWQTFFRFKKASAFPDGSISKRISDFIAERTARWLIRIGADAKAVSYWFCRTVARDVTSSQRRALTAAGLPENWLKEKWTVPVIGKQYISPQAAKSISESVKENTELISNVAAKDLQRLQDVIVENLEKGGTVGDISKALTAIEGIDEKRALRIAVDQSNKVANAVSQANAKAAGITRGIWVHVPGQYTSRETHIAMNGKEFDLEEGMWDEDVQAYVHCGSLPYCRCIYRPVLPKELLNG